MPTMLTYHLALQMLFLATFFPTWEGGAGVYDFVGVCFFITSVLQQLIVPISARVFNVCLSFQEFMKATVDLADLLGLHLVMSRNPGKGEYKIMVAAMGWATAELVMSRQAAATFFQKVVLLSAICNHCNSVFV